MQHLFSVEVGFYNKNFSSATDTSFLFTRRGGWGSVFLIVIASEIQEVRHKKKTEHCLLGHSVVFLIQSSFNAVSLAKIINRLVAVIFWIVSRASRTHYFHCFQVVGNSAECSVIVGIL